MHIVSLFCEIDDFFLAFENYQARHQLPGTPSEKRGRPRTLHPSEVMTILVNFHQSGYQTFKDYYLKEVCLHLRWAFPDLVSYNRFVALMPETLLALSVYLYTRFGSCDGVSFMDSTRLPGLRESAYSKASRLRRTGRSWQDLARMVLWVQTSFTHQHTRRPPRC